VNLQEPFRRTEHGVDTADQLLDLVRTRDGDWRWKDEHELANAIAEGFISEDEAAAIHARPEA
jgi:predicted RNA-binding protein associated with RNAse of E/G family